MRPTFSKSDFAYEEIKRRILSASLAAGAIVPQERLAAELEISTTPIREALKRLAAEGMVSLAPHRDARVTELTVVEARSLLEVRLNLDPLAARLAAERRTAEDLAAINDALAALEPLTGGATYEALVAHRTFHRAVYAASQNANLTGILDGLWDKADRYRMFSLAIKQVSATERERVQREHAAIAAAIEGRDAEHAEAVMRQHIEKSLGQAALEALS